jgi:hypothetical protein
METEMINDHTPQLTTRFQRRDGRIQEYLIHRMGCRRTRQNQASMETLLVSPLPLDKSHTNDRLPKHPGYHLRRRFE